MEDIDMSLNYENSEFMTSEFFDSVLSLENNMEENFLPIFEDDKNVCNDDLNIFSDTSSHLDDVLSPNSDSDQNSLESLDDSIISSVDALDDPFLLSLLETQNFETAPEVAIKPEISETKPLFVKEITAPIQQTKIVIQNPYNKKIITKPVANVTPQKQIPLKGKSHILKVRPILNNGSPVLLPLNMKGIKILKTPVDMNTLASSLKKRKIDHNSNSQHKINGNVLSSNSYPPLLLTQEEKRLLAKEGIQLPTHHPLTKNEERELKRIRRKIRNKISAQDSRKRKKEYVDGLEERVKRGSEENRNLLQRVRMLQRQNKTLIAHVNKLQALIRNSTTSKATPSTCLMVVLLSALLVSLPNIKLFENKPMSSEVEQAAVRRSLLSSTPQTEDSNINMEEFLVFNEDKEKFDELFDIENSTEKEFEKIMEGIEKDYDSLSNKNKSKLSFFSKVFETLKHFIAKENHELFENIGYGGYNSKKVFIEPDIDDYAPSEGPPLKKAKFDAEENSNALKENEQILLTTIGPRIHAENK